MRYVFVGDMHFMDRNPKWRTDDHLQAGLDMLHEIFQIADEHQAAIVFVGDLFDRANVGGRVRNAVMSALFTLAKEYDTCGVFCCVGNHDIDNTSSGLEHSALYSLALAGALSIDSAFESFSFEHWRHGIENELRTVGTASDEPICVAHAYILPSPAPFKHVLCDDVKTNAKLVISGHYHPAFHYNRPDGVVFINPGCVSRHELSEDSKTRMPSVTVVNYDEEDHFGFTAETVYLSCCKPASEIFALEEQAEEKAGRTRSLDFVQQMSKLTQWRGDANKETQLRHAAEEKGLRASALDVVLRVYRESRRALDARIAEGRGGE